MSMFCYQCEQTAQGTSPGLSRRQSPSLLTLLSLGVKNIRLGPNLPAFVTPGVLQVLVEAYGLSPVGTVKGDLAKIMQTA